MRDTAYLTTLDTIFYRMLFVQWSDQLLAPARSAMGRSHYGGQDALYLSGTPEGCIIASRRYVKSGDPERAIYPLHVQSTNIIDLRDPAAAAHYNVDTTHRATDWLAITDSGARSPTWDISDRIRDLGIDGMLYASRSDPTKTHLTLFNWTTGQTVVRPNGTPHPASFE